MLAQCGRCEVAIDAVIEGRYAFGEDDSPAERVFLCRCPRCNEPVLLRDDEISDPVQIFPTFDRPLSRSVPESIRKCFQEARECFRAHAHTATALMCRRTLEAIAKDHGVEERNLASSLNSMRDRGIIENRLFDWGEALRLVGNEAAHQVDRAVHGQDAQDVLEFTNALLEYLYTFRDRFDAFQKRRAERGDA
jgi:hypothetical protein